MAGQVAEQTQQLAALLTKNRVPQAVVDFIVKPVDQGGKGFESISDFASVYTEANYAEKLEVLISKTEAKDDEVALGRLRTAWLFACSELRKMVSAVEKGAAEVDWDTPLDETEEEKRRAEFDPAYDSLTFEAESMPAAAIIGRFFREFRTAKRQISVAQLKRMRSEAECRPVLAAQSTQLAENVRLTYTQAPRMPDRSFGSLLDVLYAIKLLTNCWVLTGATKVESKIHMEKATNSYLKVRECHLSQALAYYDFCCLKARAHPGPPQATISWLLDRDRQTRAKARTLFAQGWPYGEAVHHAKDTAVSMLWNQGKVGIAPLQTPILDAMEVDVWSGEEDAGGRPGGGAARGQQVRTPFRSKKKNKNKAKGKKSQQQSEQNQQPKKPPCPMWNSAAGCTRRQADCPQQKGHYCSICGNWRHGAHNCGARR